MTVASALGAALLAGSAARADLTDCVTSGSLKVCCYNPSYQANTATCGYCPSDDQIYKPTDASGTGTISCQIQDYFGNPLPCTAATPYGMPSTNLQINCTDKDTTGAIIGQVNKQCSVFVYDGSLPSLDCHDFPMGCGTALAAPPQGSGTCWPVETVCTVNSQVWGTSECTMDSTGNPACSAPDPLSSITPVPGLAASITTDVQYTCVASTMHETSNSCSTNWIKVSAASAATPQVTAWDGKMLWPPTHQYTTITLDDCIKEAKDPCSLQDFDATLNGVITAVISDEAEDTIGLGDGRTCNDITIDPTGKSAQLRAEREGATNGRFYTVYYSISNQYVPTAPPATGSCRIGVPHDSTLVAPAMDPPKYCVDRGDGTCLKLGCPVYTTGATGCVQHNPACTF
jgi:hypothetical protein